MKPQLFLKQWTCWNASTRDDFHNYAPAIICAVFEMRSCPANVRGNVTPKGLWAVLPRGDDPIGPSRESLPQQARSVTRDC